MVDRVVALTANWPAARGVSLTRRMMVKAAGRRRMKHGVFRSVVDLQAGINRFIADHNTRPTPSSSERGPHRIIALVRPYRLDTIH